MTIEERVEGYFKGTVAYEMAADGVKEMARQSLKRLLLEVARDQCIACAEAITEIERNAWSMDAAKQAVMSAEIK